MSAKVFRVQEHSIPTTHIREYPRATIDDQEDVLQLAVKQYTPRETLKATNKVTIIGAHANGFPKELYEPLWDELYEHLKARGISIHDIFIADVAHQGVSGVLNEQKLGNDPSWLDHPRDLFLMVNHFRSHMKRPLVGIGHSMGGNNVVNLSLMHPRLFTTLILIDPVIQRLPSAEGNFGPARASTKRRDRWPSRKVAEESFKRSKFYQAWDPRVLDLWIRHGLRDLPTYIHPAVSTKSETLPIVTADPSTAAVTPDPNTEREVTLTTTKHQEVFTFLRPNFPTPDYPSPGEEPNPATNPDVDTNIAPSTPFYAPVGHSTFYRLPFLRPSVFYIFGDKSDLSAPVLIADRLACTGTGPGGSGGVKKGRVRQHTFKGVGHLIPMEVVNETAEACADWLSPEIDRWRLLEDAERRSWQAVPKEQKMRLSEEYVTRINSDWIETAKDKAGRGSKL